MCTELFHRDLLSNCIGEDVWAYYLPRPLSIDFEDCIKCLGELKYPLGKGFNFIKLVTEDFLLTGNVGLCELRLTIKLNARPDTRERFELELDKYLKEVKNGI